MQKETGLVAMCGHTRRFNPSHQYVHKKIKAGEFNIQQMDVQTYFFRRTNMNALGQPRSWTDHLLWHHAAHTVDLFAYQMRQPDREGQCDPGADPSDAGHRDGHEHPAQGGQRRDLHAVAVASTTKARWAPSSATSATRPPTSRATTTCSTARKRRSTCRKVDVSMNGIELQDREFFAAIREGREPNASVAQVLPCYEVLHQLEQQLSA